MAGKGDIGRVTAEVRRFPVELGKVREFARAIGEDNPVFYDEARAREAGFAAPPAPLTFAETLRFWSDAPPVYEQLGLDLRFVLDGGREFEYRRPVVAGEVLSAVTKVVDVYEKAGKRGGTMTFVILETTFVDEKGEVVLLSRQTLIQTGGVVARES
ncbi:MAG: MaoC family dehydratase N-terminal domain-containing protein [Clostridia bacterium]|nr:MaoC family dehydratase N-terminal domain-containing protein [Clostridia bacterium]